MYNDVAAADLCRLHRKKKKNSTERERRKRIVTKPENSETEKEAKSNGLI
jgi:hypothetical protein